MRVNRTAAPISARVQGLGSCDVLRIQLEPCQIAGMIDELEERRGPLHKAFEHARARWDSLEDWQREGRQADDAETDLAEAAYALWLFGAIRAQLPAVDHDERVALLGPASIIAELVASVARNAVEDLGEQVRQPLGSDEVAQTRLRDVAARAAEWVQTYAECSALVWFRFDEDWDPVRDVTWPRLSDLGVSGDAPRR
jgi:hypothetical protein